MSTSKSDVSPSMSPGKAPTLARATTLAQIAEFVGVSPVAVSVVLNNSRSQVRVSQATRERILEAARELNYQPNVLVRAIRKRSTNVVAFYCTRHDFVNPLFPFFGNVLQGLLAGCGEHRKNFMLHGTFEGSDEDEIYQELLNGQVDGLILYSLEKSQLAERLALSHLPVITIVNEVANVPCVTVEDEVGGRLLCQHLAEKGYRSALYFVIEKNPATSIERRVKGFQDEAALHGMEVEIFNPKTRFPFAADFAEIMARKNRPEVLVAFSDSMAHEFMTWCQSAGWNVPADIAVAGFDGFETPHGLLPVTTIRASWSEVSRVAVSLLVQQCGGNAVPMFTKLPVELVIGETS